jgi:hypothetical protein
MMFSKNIAIYNRNMPSVAVFNQLPSRVLPGIFISFPDPALHPAAEIVNFFKSVVFYNLRGYSTAIAGPAVDKDIFIFKSR